jgi:tetratricopeptide (TPR) repeat protein
MEQELNPDNAEGCLDRGFFYYNQGDYQRALEWYHKALAIREKTSGKEHPDTAATYGNIAVIYYAQGDYPRVLKWLHKALAAYERLAEKDLLKYGDDLAGCYFSQACILHDMKRYDEAEAAYHVAIGYRERLAQNDPWNKYENQSALALAVNNLGSLYRSAEHYSEAEPLYRRALSIREKLLEEHPGEAEHERALAIQLYRFGLLYAETGRNAEAEAAFTRALAIQEPLAIADPDRYGKDAEAARAALEKLKGGN